MNKFREKDYSSNPLFNEFYTLPETCETIFRPLRPFFMDKKIHCPCDDENSAIVQWLQQNTNSTITFSHLPEHDMNGDYAREMMLKSDLVVTNPPFKRSEWKPFFLWLVDNKIDYFIFGPIIQAGDRPLYARMTYTYCPYKSNMAYYARPDGKIVPALTIFYTSLPVKNDEYSYKPSKKSISYFNGVPVFDRTCNYPKDFYDWAYVPCTAISRLNLMNYEFDITDRGVPGKFNRLKIRRKHGDDDG